MNRLKEENNKKGDYLLVCKIIEMAGNIQNGAISIIKQDSIVIQINTYEKILLQPQYEEAI